MHGLADIKSKFIKSPKKSEEPSEKRTKRKGECCIPNKKPDDAGFTWMTLFPSNFGMKNVSKNCRKCGGDKARNPENVIIINDACNNRICQKIKNC